jgi:hypothetical protein
MGVLPVHLLPEIEHDDGVSGVLCSAAEGRVPPTVVALPPQRGRPKEGHHVVGRAVGPRGPAVGGRAQVPVLAGAQPSARAEPV